MNAFSISVQGLKSSKLKKGEMWYAKSILISRKVIPSAWVTRSCSSSHCSELRCIKHYFNLLLSVKISNKISVALIIMMLLNLSNRIPEMWSNFLHMWAKHRWTLLCLWPWILDSKEKILGQKGSIYWGNMYLLITLI